MRHDDFECARIVAKFRASKEGKEIFVSKWHDGTWEVTERQPSLGEWWHVYPDGMVIQRGA